MEVNLPERQRRRVRPRIRPIYTVSEFAVLLCMPKRRCARLLKKIPSLPVRMLGNKRMVYLKDVREVDPDLYEAIRLKLEDEHEADAIEGLSESYRLR